MYKLSITHWRSGRYGAGLIALPALVACGQVTSGPAVSEQRTVESFHAIEMRGAATIDVLVGPAQSISLTAARETLAALDASVKNGTLILEQRKRGFWMMKHGNLQIRITAPTLDAVAINGAGDVSINGLTGGELSLAVQGASDLEASGKVDTLNASINGAGDMDLSRLVATTATVAVNGAGDLTVNVTGTLNAEVNGVGSIDYLGHPATVVPAIHGVGSISPK